MSRGRLFLPSLALLLASACTDPKIFGIKGDGRFGSSGSLGKVEGTSGLDQKQKDTQTPGEGTPQGPPTPGPTKDQEDPTDPTDTDPTDDPGQQDPTPDDDPSQQGDPGQNDDSPGQLDIIPGRKVNSLKVSFEDGHNSDFEDVIVCLRGDLSYYKEGSIHVIYSGNEQTATASVSGSGCQHEIEFTVTHPGGGVSGQRVGDRSSGKANLELVRASKIDLKGHTTKVINSYNCRAVFSMQDSAKFLLNGC